MCRIGTHTPAASMSMDENGGHSPIANWQHGMVPTKRRIAATLAEESMGQIKQIVEFWTKCDLKNPPFVHPDDRAVLSQYSESKPDLPTYDFRRFVLSPRFGAFSDPRLHFSLLPVPYAGDLARADIFRSAAESGTQFHRLLRRMVHARIQAAIAIKSSATFDEGGVSVLVFGPTVLLAQRVYMVGGEIP